MALHASHVSTLNIVGTGPYMPPEYFQSGRVGVKTDAYAFGVVLLELLSGLPAADPATRALLTDTLHEALDDPAGQLPARLDAKAGAWDTSKACALAAVVSRCLEFSTRRKEAERCAVADVLGEIEELAELQDGRLRTCHG